MMTIKQIAAKTLKWPLAVVALGLGISTASAVPITIVNGGFESPTISSGFVTTFSPSNNVGLPGWNVIDGSVDIYSVNGGWDPAAGLQSLDLNGVKAGTIQQTISLAKDGLAQIRFSLAGNPQLINKTVEVSLIGSTDGPQTFTFIQAGHDKHTMGWTQHVAYFDVPSAGSYILQFKSLNTVSKMSAGPALDAISMTVPDGGLTVMLLGMSVTTLGLIRRKLS
jgi:hypothetical protein